VQQPGSNSGSLIERVQGGDRDGWRRLVSLYTPLVLYWCRRQGVSGADAEDVAQEVFRAVAARVADFSRQAPGSFRRWLHRITRNKLGDLFRRQRRQPQAAGGEGHDLLDQLPDQGDAEPGESEEMSERAILCRRALELVRAEFEARTWDMAWQVIVEGQRPADVAANAGVRVRACPMNRSALISGGTVARLPV
jgi:RNA polymerase sigma-70 factor (ECF subfamily)